MSDKYTPHHADGLYFLTLTVVEWVDVFTRREYKQVVVDSLRYCQAALAISPVHPECRRILQRSLNGSNLEFDEAHS